MTDAIYNEIEPFAASWLDELVKRGAIAPGRVDRRSIRDLAAADVAGPGQRHFFAGIGVWSYALRLAGVPDDVSIWTGSCPCQPFSGAGKRGGVDDPRHLWPTWFGLIRECRPAIVFGEQVASPDGLAWLDLVFADLEGAGYSVGASDLCAAGVGAPHIRQRLFFVAYAREGGQRIAGPSAEWQRDRTRRSEQAGELADAAGRPGGFGLHAGPQGSSDVGRTSSGPRGQRDAAQGAPCELGDAVGERIARCAGSGEVPRAQAEGAARLDGDHGAQHAGAAGRLGDACLDGNREHARELRRDESEHEERAAHRNHAPVTAGATRGPWADADWIPCADGVSRPVESGTFPLAHGAPCRVGRLRGYGNAIVSEAAATFIEAALEAGRDLIA